MVEKVPSIERNPDTPAIVFYAVAKGGVEHPETGSTYTLVTARWDGVTTVMGGIPVRSVFETWK